MVQPQQGQSDEFSRRPVSCSKHHPIGFAELPAGQTCVCNTDKNTQYMVQAMANLLMYAINDHRFPRIKEMGQVFMAKFLNDPEIKSGVCRDRIEAENAADYFVQAINSIREVGEFELIAFNTAPPIKIDGDIDDYRCLVVNLQTRHCWQMDIEYRGNAYEANINAVSINSLVRDPRYPRIGNVLNNLPFNHENIGRSLGNLR